MAKTKIRFNVWLSVGEEPMTYFQFLRPDEGAYARPGAVVIGHVVEVSNGVGGVLLWRPKPDWRDADTRAAVARQWDAFKTFVQSER
jgi:hypothetical protein